MRPLRTKPESVIALVKNERERGERFLAAYNVIEHELRRRWGDPGSRESFRRMVDVLKSRDSVVRRFKDDLEEFADLRNAIVHERISPDYLIAVPLEETVRRIEEIAQLMRKPPLVYPRFSREVISFDIGDRADRVLQTIKKTSFSQFPVYEESRYIGLLTDGAVARWMADRIHGGCGKGCAGLDEILSATVKEIIGYERGNRARFLPRNATIYEAQEIFREGPPETERQVLAVLITDNGKPEENLLGIITPSDLLRDFSRDFRDPSPD
ncbi:MAG TPA: CBS domain-containing protein [Firmicutes bacterium]|nr:CBS domain-containing protein [Candidatus Fermentithermobacillaceae bacterium]